MKKKPAHLIYTLKRQIQNMIYRGLKMVSIKYIGIGIDTLKGMAISYKSVE